MFDNLKLNIKISNYRKIIDLIKNSGWIFFDKIFRIATSLFVGVWIARYLGPDKFGIINYIGVFPLMFSALAGLGLTNILYNEFIVQKDDAIFKKIFTTGILIKLIAGIFSLILVVVASSVIDKDKALILLVSVSGTSLITQSIDVVDTYFQSQRKVEYSIIPKLIVFTCTTGLRMVGLWLKYDIVFFVVMNSIEVLFSSFASFLICVKYLHLKISDFRVDITLAKDLLNRSWPLMLSELFLFLYQRVDLLMLKKLASNAELGKYSVAMRFTDLWYFIPIALTSSLYPNIIAFRQSNYKEYLHRYQHMLSAFAFISICIGGFLTLTANSIINFLYGNKYDGVGAILSVNVWTGVFVFLAIGVSNWFVVESLQKFVLRRTILGAVINVVLNFVLIPLFGAIGTSVPTLVAQVVVSYLMNGLYSRTKQVFMLQTKALLFLPKFAFGLLRRSFRPI